MTYIFNLPLASKMLNNCGGVKAILVQNTAIQTLLCRWVKDSVEARLLMFAGCAADEDGLGSGIVGCDSSSKRSGLQTKKTKAISDNTWTRVKSLKEGNDSVRCSDAQANDKCAASEPEKAGRKFVTFANTCGQMLLAPLACASASAPVAIFTFGCSSKPFPVSTDMIFSLQASSAHPP